MVWQNSLTIFRFFFSICGNTKKTIEISTVLDGQEKKKTTREKENQTHERRSKIEVVENSF